MPPPPPSPPKSILVHVGLDLVGDGLLKLPFVNGLRAAFPQARITWLAGTGPTVFDGPLKAQVEGKIDEVIQTTGLTKSWKRILGHPLRGTAGAGRTWDLVIDTQTSTRPALILWRVPHRLYLSSALKYRLCFERPPADYTRPAHMTRRLLDLLWLATGKSRTFPMTYDLISAPGDREEAERRLPSDGAGTAPWVALCPGAGGRWKCWPLERFVEVARQLADRGVRPVFLLGPDETEWRHPIAEALSSARFPLQDAAWGSLTLSAAVMGQCATVVCNDAGVGHIAAGSGAPLISLFGPTPPEKFAPCTDKGTILRAQDWGGPEMERIPVESVVEAVWAALPSPS
ncbi:MAG: glycosyltransferase family 9 protein [Rhodospirillum sp.]|nr:glycosyltransferase family 9 protein [Rhodospirillum sp.]MCF8487896.1 glycosyltransferase family 9 protein [Rhodospirillum sp.]MCF8501448.1 glycosyltransferase family 9 protein [Rhodospirillum sp.]